MSTRSPGNSSALQWMARLMLFVTAIAFVIVSIGVWRVVDRTQATFRPPRTPVDTLAAKAALGNFQSVSFTSFDGVELKGWYVPPTSGAAVLMSHGYGANRQQLLPEAAALVQHGYGVLMFDWRAHGESGGDRCTWGENEQKDLQAALSFLANQREVNPRRIGALGFSMGGMITAEVAAKDPQIRAVVLEGPLPSVEDTFRVDEHRMGWISGTAAVLTLKWAQVPLERLRPVQSLCQISPRPLLLVYGERDSSAPPELAQQMYQAACEPKRIWAVPGATHNTLALYGREALGQTLVSFFNPALFPRLGALH